MHNRKSHRLKKFDYSSQGAYFITMNVKDRIHWFGSIRDRIMVLNGDGVIAHRCWDEIPYHFHGCRIGDFVVMPDHVHGIIFVDENPGRGRNPRRGRIYAAPTGAAPTGAVYRPYQNDITENNPAIQGGGDQGNKPYP